MGFIARTAFAPRDMSISSVTALLGAPIVLYLMASRRGGGAEPPGHLPLRHRGHVPAVQVHRPAQGGQLADDAFEDGGLARAVGTDEVRTAQPLVILPACFLGGGAFCLLCDLIARTAFAPRDMSISSVTALLGAP